MPDATTTKHLVFPGHLLMLGCGSIGQGVLPLLLRHIDMPAENISILTADARGSAVAAGYGIAEEILPVTGENFREALAARLTAGDFLLNLSVAVSSVALIQLCRELGVLYLDTCIEPWAGGYTDLSLTPSQRSNYALRETALALTEGPGAPTAVLAHGANPGLVSHFVKRALLHIARDTSVAASAPENRRGWAALARDLGIKVIHIAERDTQVANIPKQPAEFVNTWSIDGFIGEGCQPAELGWGTHEMTLPADARHHESGCGAAIYLLRPGAATRVRTWTPMGGPLHGFLITHNEAISIADYLTLRENGGVAYRPTVHYAYHPCDDAVLSVHELASRNRSRGRDDGRRLRASTSAPDPINHAQRHHPAADIQADEFRPKPARSSA
jgi:homospermidine synthase